MSEIEIKQLQEKINAGILLARKRLIEKTKKENGELVVVRDGKVVCIKAQEFRPRLPQSRGFFIDGNSSQKIAGRTDFQPETAPVQRLHEPRELQPATAVRHSSSPQAATRRSNRPKPPLTPLKERRAVAIPDEKP